MHRYLLTFALAALLALLFSTGCLTDNDDDQNFLYNIISLGGESLPDNLYDGAPTSFKAQVSDGDIFTLSEVEIHGYGWADLEQGDGGSYRGEMDWDDSLFTMVDCWDIAVTGTQMTGMIVVGGPTVDAVAQEFIAEREEHE